VKAVVDRYSGLMPALHDGAAKRLYVGEPPGLRVLQMSFQNPRTAARIATAAAMVAHTEGRDDDALCTLADVAALGVNLDSGEYALGLVAGLVCASIQHRAATAVILRGHPSDAALRSHVARLEGLTHRPPGFAATCAFDLACWEADLDRLRIRNAFMRKSALERATGESVPGPELQALGLKSASVRAWLRDRYARLIEEVAKPAHERDTGALRARTKRDAQERGDVTSPVAEADADMAVRYLSMHAQLAAEEVMCALELYRREHGAYPADLGPLAPAYLPALPEDPFSGDPLVYRVEAEGYTLYSVGPNKIDDGGVSKGPRALEPDQVFVGGTYLDQQAPAAAGQAPAEHDDTLGVG
jgi:hypothetical protein